MRPKCRTAAPGLLCPWRSSRWPCARCSGPLRAEGALCEHSTPCPPANAADHLAASVLVGHAGADWSVLCNGVILFEDTGYLLPTGGVVGPRRPLPGGAVTTWPSRPRPLSHS
ncbi:DUF5999 family protein [Streptomyces sp. NPDC002917]|uniref:DUF5999 family protein n=1 Tax=Streptomyces sp. NPDC002917 TaxID=3364671 RepID=UPI0036B3D088